MERLLYMLLGKKYLVDKCLMYFDCQNRISLEKINKKISEHGGMEIGWDGIQIYGASGYKIDSMSVQQRGVKILSFIVYKHTGIIDFTWSDFIQRNPYLKKTYIEGIAKGAKGIKEYREYENFKKDIEKKEKLKIK